MPATNRDRGATTTSEQGPLLTEFLNEPWAHTGERWLLIFDGGRYDVFANLYNHFFEGELRAVHNGNHTLTVDWCSAHLDGDYPNWAFISLDPIWKHEHGEWDEREHFGDVFTPAARVDEQLAALGYTETDTQSPNLPLSPLEQPAELNAVARDVHEDNSSIGGVCRYTLPHPPLVGLEELTSGSGKMQRVWDALEAGDLTRGELWTAYERTYQAAFAGAVGLVSDLDAEVVITADHGTCLSRGTCEQWFHARGHDAHSHLTTVPWLRVDGITPQTTSRMEAAQSDG